MAGKPQRWTPERLRWLAATVAEHIERTGRVNWTTVAAQAGTTANGVRFAYQSHAQNGQCESIPQLRARYRVGELVEAPASAPSPEQEVETRTTEAGIEARSHGSRIRTVEELLAHIEADLTKYEIDRAEATKYEQAAKGPDGQVVVTELHRVWVKLKPKAGPTTQDIVDAMITAAFADRRPVVPTGRARTAVDPDLLHALVIADTHIGKHAWGRETGWGDYDTHLAVQCLRDAASDLLDRSASRRPGRRAIWLLGDILHVDTLQGTTTRGTPQDRDSRLPKLIEEGIGVLFDIIDGAAMDVPVDVVLVPGNHDHVLSWALQRLLVERYRDSKKVTVDATYTQRKYARWGRCLFGLTHGDRARKKLPQLMARERPVDWGQSALREIHTGHLHETNAIQTIDGVITRTAPSLSAADAWHAHEGYVGSLRAMEAFYYHRDGEMIGLDVASVRVDR